MFNGRWTADNDCTSSFLMVDVSQTMIVRFMFNGRCITDNDCIGSCLMVDGPQTMIV